MPGPKDPLGGSTGLIRRWITLLLSYTLSGGTQRLVRPLFRPMKLCLHYSSFYDLAQATPCLYRNPYLLADQTYIAHML